MGDMTEPEQTVDEVNVTEPTQRAIDPCPTCGAAVADLEGRTPVKSTLDDDTFAKQIFDMPAGPMRWKVKPCGHRVAKPVMHADRIELAVAE